MRNYATISCVCKKVSEKKIVSGNMISCMVFLFKFTRNSQTRETVVKNIHAQFGMMTNTKMLANHTFLSPPSQLLS